MNSKIIAMGLSTLALTLLVSSNVMANRTTPVTQEGAVVAKVTTQTHKGSLCRKDTECASGDCSDGRCR